MRVCSLLAMDYIEAVVACSQWVPKQNIQTYSRHLQVLSARSCNMLCNANSGGSGGKGCKSSSSVVFSFACFKMLFFFLFMACVVMLLTQCKRL